MRRPPTQTRPNTRCRSGAERFKPPVLKFGGGRPDAYRYVPEHRGLSGFSGPEIVPCATPRIGQQRIAPKQLTFLGCHSPTKPVLACLFFQRTHRARSVLYRDKERFGGPISLPSSPAGP